METARRRTKDRQVDGSTGILSQAVASRSPLFVFGCFTSSEETKAREVKSHPEIQLLSREASRPNEVYWKHRPEVSYHTDYSPFQKARSTVLFLKLEGIKPA